MKYRISIILSVLLAGAVSCTGELRQEESTPDSKPSSTEIFIPDGYVRLNIDSPTKAKMENLDVVWEAGDRICVNGEATDILYDEVQEIFYAVAPEAESYEAIYPAEIYTQWKGVMIPDVQFYREGSFARHANFMTAFSSSINRLHFSHKEGILHLKVKGDAEIASINIQDNAGAPLCGYLSKNSAGMWSTWSETLKYDNITINCKSPEGDGLDIRGGKDFYAVIPAGTYSQGLTITISGKDGHAMVLESDTPRTIVAGEILHTPEITYSIPAGQVYEYHFDAMAFGGDPVSGFNRGYKIASSSSPTGYEISNDINGVSTAGTANISTEWSDPGVFSLSNSYISSRNLQDFQFLFDMFEFHGYLGGGVNGNSRAIFRLPVMKNIPAGKICKVRLKFRFAWQKDHCGNPLMFYPHFTGSGNILEYYVDGIKMNIPKDGTGTRWVTGDASSLGAAPLTASNHCNEYLLIKTEDTQDYNWHEIEMVLGACSNSTVVNMQSHLKNRNDGGFFIDDISAYIEEYEDLEALKTAGETVLSPALLISPYSSIPMRNMTAQAKSLGMKYVDIYINTSYLYNTLGGNASKWLEAFTTYAGQIKAAGLRVWGIHLPYENLSNSPEDFYFDISHNVSSYRTAAVDRMKAVMTALAPFEAQVFVAHPSIHGDRLFSDFHGFLEASCSELVAHAQNLGGVFAIENIMRNDQVRWTTVYWTQNSIAFKPENLNSLCANVPGLKICFDASHAIVKSTERNGAQGISYKAEDYARILGSNIATVHMHDGCGADDIHLIPGYAGTITDSSGVQHWSTIDWGKLYKAIVEDCGYRGPFVYEYSSYAPDCIASFSGLAHNYYGYILPCYRRETNN